MTSSSPCVSTVEEVAPNLGNQPDANALLFLPRLIREDDGAPVFSASTPSMVKLLNQTGKLQVQMAIFDKAPAFRDERASDWLGPVLWISNNMDASVAALALNVISAYLYDIFKGQETTGKVKISAVVEESTTKTRTKTVTTKATRISYEGPLDGLPQFQSALKTAMENRDNGIENN